MYNTKLLKINRDEEKTADLSEAVALLRAGELVAFPTETVYGLGGNAEDETASSRIYAAKGRASDNPLIVHIADKKDLLKVGREVSEKALKLAEKFWPGPLTIIVKKASIIPPATTGGLDTVAVRMPSDVIASRLISESGLFIAAPSANASGRPSTTRAEHCMEDLAGKIPLVIDGGPVKIGLESTIVDTTGDELCILRPGHIRIEELREIDPKVYFDPAVIADKPQENIVAKAPGMKYRHYAPKGEFTVFEGEKEAVIARINAEAEACRKAGKSCAVFASDETKERYRADLIISPGRREVPDEVAAGLFDALRKFDEAGAECIFGEAFTGNAYRAVSNRLMKACGYNIKKV